MTMATRADHADFSVQTVEGCKINTARSSYIIEILINLPYSFRKKWYTIEQIHEFIVDGIARTISVYELKKTVRYKQKSIPYLQVKKYSNIRYYQFGVYNQEIQKRPCRKDLLPLPPVAPVPRLENNITNDNPPVPEKILQTVLTRR